MKAKVSYSARCVLCGYIPGSWSRRRKIAVRRGERHRMTNVPGYWVKEPLPATPTFHDFDIEREPKLEPKRRGRMA